MAESVPDVQTTSQEDLAEVTSSDQTENSYEEEAKTISTFGFDVKTQKTDLTLIFGEHRLYVRRSFLEDASPILDRLFEEKLAGKTDQEVIMEDVSCEDFAEFLACIQWRGRRKISKENAYRMLAVASKYEIEDVKERCEDCLLDILDEEKQNEKSVLNLLHLANENNLSSLKSKCMERADWRILNALQEQDKSFNLSSTSKIELEGRFMPVLFSNSYIVDFLKTSSSSKENVAKILDFDDAKGFKTCCNVSTQTYKHTFKLWDITWTLEVGGVPLYSNTFYPWLIRLQANQNINPINSSCTTKTGIACKILNYIPKKEDCSALKTFTFQETMKGISWNSWYDMDIQESALQDENRGFSDDGKFDIEVYILMTKPESASS